MDKALRQEGFRTLNLDYESRRKPLDDLARDVRRSIEPLIEAGGPIHFVTHSMGGLVVRRMVGGTHTAWLGRVVMIGPPNQGSEIADLLHRRRLFRRFLGPAAQQLTTAACADLGRLGAVGYQVGVLAGLKPHPLLSRLLLPGPSDGKVTVRSTRLDGMADHRVIRGAHPWLMRNEAAIAQTIAFLRDGCFGSKA